MKEKMRCECCEKLFNKSKLVINKVTKQRVCYFCNKRIGSNKFYNPLTQKRNRIGKFSLNNDEEKFLKNKGINVSSLCKALKTMKEISKKKKKEDFLMNKKKIEEDREQQKKFLEGLNQKTK